MTDGRSDTTGMAGATAIRRPRATRLAGPGPGPGPGLDPGIRIAEPVSESPSWRSLARRDALRYRRQAIAILLADYREQIAALEAEDGDLECELARIAHGHSDLLSPPDPEPPPGLTPEETADDD